MAAICTKDQAYALYLLPALAIAFHLWSSHRAAGRAHPLWETLTDCRLATAAVVSVGFLALCYNLAFNLEGILAHVRSITDTAAVYQVFERNLAGRLALLRATTRLTAISMGWPLFFVSLVGVGLALSQTERRGTALGCSSFCPWTTSHC